MIGAEAGGAYGALDAALIVDFLVGARLRQASGLEDGAARAPRAGVARAELRWRLDDGMAISARYRLDVARVSFAGDSVRLPGTADTARTDQSHTALVGLDLDL